jgi:hypothetical protein
MARDRQRSLLRCGRQALPQPTRPYALALPPCVHIISLGPPNFPSGFFSLLRLALVFCSTPLSFEKVPPNHAQTPSLPLHAESRPRRECCDPTAPVIPDSRANKKQHQSDVIVPAAPLSYPGSLDDREQPQETHPTRRLRIRGSDSGNTTPTRSSLFGG